MFILHTHSSQCIKSEIDLFSLPLTQISIENSQWIYYKPVSYLIQKIRHTRTWRRLSGSHIMLNLHTRKKRTQREHIGRIRRHGKSKTRKSFTAFHVQPNRRIFLSKTRIAIKQRLRVRKRGVIKLCFTHKNFPCNLLLMVCGCSRLWGDTLDRLISKYGARETRATFKKIMR